MKKFYLGINNFLNHHIFIKSTIYFLSRFCPWMVGVFYALFVLKIYLDYQQVLVTLLCKPVIVFILTSLLRMSINRPRPAEYYGFSPIDEKRLKGRSFPSIHVAVALSIAFVVLNYGPNMGLLLSALAVIITCTRLLTGVHYISDIIASILIAVAVALV
ncbi:MAG: phosphatase PAP2 family protein [Thomasclavelia sp.]|nr:phosphatase PAP2 family protein [Thomasclavelia sp.]